MKIATYNVNSIRARFDRLVAWLGREQPDVTCLQEIKVTEDEFPRLELEALGYHVAVHGQRTYNGVAIVSRLPLEDVRAGLEGAPDEARLIGARVGETRILSVYVPNGQTVGSDKWAYKLAPATPSELLGDCFAQRLVTQMYFPGDPLFEFDPIFNSVRDERARRRLIARFSMDRSQENWALAYEFDIVLRGRDETPMEEAH